LHQNLCGPQGDPNIHGWATSDSFKNWIRDSPVWLRAMKDIEVGEELLVDYPPPFADNWEDNFDKRRAHAARTKGITLVTSKKQNKLYITTPYVYHRSAVCGRRE